MRTLKVVVIALGVLIVVAVVALVLKITDGAAPLGSRASYPPSTVEIPRGAEVIATELSGERLILHVRLENGDLRFIVVSLATGKEIGTVDVHEAPAQTP